MEEVSIKEILDNGFAFMDQATTNLVTTCWHRNQCRDSETHRAVRDYFSNIERIHVPAGTKMVPILGLTTEEAVTELELLLPRDGTLTKNFDDTVENEIGEHVSFIDVTFHPRPALGKRKRGVEWDDPWEGSEQDLGIRSMRQIMRRARRRGVLD
jgi:hypothetical protein